jgi:hypothetical protein
MVTARVSGDIRPAGLHRLISGRGESNPAAKNMAGGFWGYVAARFDDAEP